MLLSTPLWLSQVGLYQYLALEIMIWMLFALGYNLLLGYTGLPSFGHGAYFGIGAYAFGLLQQRLWANLWFDLLGADAGRRDLRRAGGAASSRTGAASTTRCSPSPSARCSGSSPIKWHRLTGGEDGLLNIKRLPADFGFATINLAAATKPCSTSASPSSPSSLWRCGGWCIRRSAAC